MRGTCCCKCGSVFTDDLPGMCVLVGFWYCGPCHPTYRQEYVLVFRSDMTVAVRSETEG